MPSPSLPPSTFAVRLLALNGPALQDCRRWLFLPGMRFGDLEKWWGSKGGRRTSPHEGIDLWSYVDSEGGRRQLQAGIRVPALYAGQVIKGIDDFLGKTLFILHPGQVCGETVLLGVYGHIRPCPDIQPGAEIRQGQPIGEIAGSGRKSAVPPHLHLTTGWLPASFLPARLSWESISQGGSRLFDPLSILRLPE